METYLLLIFLHVDVGVCVPCGDDGAHEGVGDRWLLLMAVVGIVVVCYQTAEARCGNVPGEMATVLLLIARVTWGGRERQREGEQEEERKRPSIKPSTRRKCGTVREESFT